jgi:hypothetical protein
MATLSKASLVVGLLFTSASACLALCDNLCRERIYHRNSTGTSCVEFGLPTCLNCAPGLNVECQSQSSDSPELYPYCVTTQVGGNWVYRYDTCSPQCTTPGKAVYEASAPSGMLLSGPDSIDQMKCRPNRPRSQVDHMYFISRNSSRR